MARRTIWIAAGLTVLAGLGLGAYALHVHALSRAFDERIEAYRAKGQPTRWADLEGPSIPDAENAAVLLQAATRLLDGLDAGSRDVLLLHAFDFDGPLDPEAQQEVRDGFEPLRPALALVREALLRPRLLLPFSPDANGLPVVPTQIVQNGESLLGCEQRAGLATAASAIGSILALADMWSVRTIVEVNARRNVRQAPLRLLRDELAAGHRIAEGDARAWTELLQRAESAERAALAASLDDERASLIELVDLMRRETGLRAWLSRRTLLSNAATLLDRIDSRWTWTTDENAFREVNREDPEPRKCLPLQSLHYLLLQHALAERATLRLARIAIQVRLQIQRGVPLPQRIEDLEGPLVADSLLDPLTGETFYWHRAGESVTVASRVADPAWKIPREWVTRLGSIRNNPRGYDVILEVR